MTTDPVLTAIIVNHQTSHLLNAVAACLSAAGISKVVIVDNSGSEDEQIALERICSTLPGSEVHTVVNNGFADAVHQGVDASGALPSDVLWILNPDVRFPPETPWRLLRELQDGDTKVVSPVITTGVGTPWFYGGELDLKQGRPQHLVNPDLRHRSVRSTFLTGTALMMRRDTWESTGGFPRDLFMYWEDAEFCLRCSAMGFNMTTVGEAVLWHEVGGSSVGEGFSELFYFFYQRNRLWVAGGQAGLRGRLRLTLRREAVKWLIYPLLREKNAKVRKCVASGRGLIAGLRAR